MVVVGGGGWWWVVVGGGGWWWVVVGGGWWFVTVVVLVMFAVVAVDARIVRWPGTRIAGSDVSMVWSPGTVTVDTCPRKDRDFSLHSFLYGRHGVL